MNLLEAFDKFDNRFNNKFEINKEWYRDNCGVYSRNIPANSIGNDGKKVKNIIEPEWYGVL